MEALSSEIKFFTPWLDVFNKPRISLKDSVFNFFNSSDLMNYPKNNQEFYDKFSNLTSLKDFCIESGLLEPRSICPNCRSSDNKVVIYMGNIYHRSSLNKCSRRWSARNNAFNFDKSSNISYYFFTIMTYKYK